MAIQPPLSIAGVILSCDKINSRRRCDSNGAVNGPGDLLFHWVTGSGTGS